MNRNQQVEYRMVEEHIVESTFEAFREVRRSPEKRCGAALMYVTVLSILQLYSRLLLPSLYSCCTVDYEKAYG